MLGVFTLHDKKKECPILMCKMLMLPISPLEFRVCDRKLWDITYMDVKCLGEQGENGGQGGTGDSRRRSWVIPCMTALSPAEHCHTHTHTHWETTGVRVAPLLARVSDFTAYWVVAFSLHEAPLFHPLNPHHHHTHKLTHPLCSVDLLVF